MRTARKPEPAVFHPVAGVAPLAGQVAVITGAAGGIGAATAHVLRGAGADLALWDRDEAGLRRLERAVGGAACALIVRVDVTRPAGVARAWRAVERRFGRVDILVSNAGAAFMAPIATCPPAVFADSLALNLVSHQLVAAGAVRLMRARGAGGVLLFNASKSAFNPGPDFGPYAVAKAGVIALMKQYALEHGADGIRANAVNADRVRTGLFRPAVLRRRAQARGVSVEGYLSGNLLGREVTAGDVAQAFLALALARATTGAVLPVDGGNIAAAPR